MLTGSRPKIQSAPAKAGRGRPRRRPKNSRPKAAKARRTPRIAKGLAQDPAGENWPLLIESLPILNGAMSRVVLMKLATVDRAPDEPEVLRQAILVGLRNPQSAEAVAARGAITFESVEFAY